MFGNKRQQIFDIYGNKRQQIFVLKHSNFEVKLSIKGF